MTVTTEHFYTGNNSTTSYAYTFPYYKTSDIKVALDNVIKTESTHYNVSGTNIVFTSGNTPGTGVEIHIYRKTDVDTSKATFAAGSSIRAGDLNNNNTQLLYAAQEEQGQGIDPTKFNDGVITSAKLAADAVTSAKIADDAINSEHYIDGSIDTAHIADAQITTAKIADDAVTADKLANTSVTAGSYTTTALTVDAQGRITAASNGTVSSGNIANDAINGDKIADDAVGAEHIEQLDADLSFADNVNASFGAGADLTIDHDGTNSIIKNTTGDLYIEDSTGRVFIRAKADENSIVCNNDGSVELYHDDSKKFETTSAGATVTGTLTADLADNSINSEHYVDGSIDRVHLEADIIDSTKIADNAVTTDHIADAELVTLAGMQTGTASILAGGTALTSTLSELNLLDGKSIVTTISSPTDAQLPTAQAVEERIVDLVTDVGGFVPIANETSFPTANPDPEDNAGTIVSVKALVSNLTSNGSGVATIANGAGSGNTVTINGMANSDTIEAGKGILVETTSTLHTYTFHRETLAPADVTAAKTAVDDFNQRYQVTGSTPTQQPDGTALEEGDLFYDTTADKMKVYDTSTSSYKEVTSTGDFKFLVAVDAGTTTAATFDGSDTSFDLKEATNSGSAASVGNVNQLMIVLNGVVQKPNAGSWSGSGEGFYLTDADTIRFATAPPTGSTCFIVQSGSAVSIPTPGDNTVATAKLQNLAVTTAKIAADAIDGTKLADDACDSEHYTDGSIDHVHLAGDCIDGDNIQDDVINSEHIAAGAIDLEHMSSESVDEDNLQISNAGSNGQYLQKQSGNTGGLTWADVPAGVGGATGVDFNDDVKARWGTGNDFTIQHKAADSATYLENADGSTFVLASSALRINNAANNENIIKADQNGAVELYYDNVKKLETVTGGATITGTCTATAFAGDGSALTGVSSSSADGCIWKNTLTISNNHTIAATEGAHSVGPITLNATVTVNGRWVIS